MRPYAVGAREAPRRAVTGLRRAAILTGLLLLALTPSDGARAGSGSHRHVARTPSHDRLEGIVFDDRNANGVHDDREPVVSGSWVAVIDDSTAESIASTVSGHDGAWSLPRPPATASHWTLQCVPAPGYRPEGSSVRTPGQLAGPHTTSFGLTAFRRLTLGCDNVLCLGTVDLGERDAARLGANPALADDDLVVGTDTRELDRLLVWFARRDGNPFLCGGRDYARDVPAPVLSLAVLDLSGDSGGRPEIVIGTRHTPAGNFFTWFPQRFPSNEGYLPARWSQAGRTRDRGDVQALAAMRVSGGAGFDLFVGTRSPGGGGTIERWRTDPAVPTSWSLAGHVPAAGDTTRLGAVTSLAVSRLGESGDDLVVGTQASAADGHGAKGVTGGELLVLGRSGDAPLATRWRQDGLGTAVRCLAIADVTGDSRPDLIVGVQETPSTGRLELWRNDTFGDALEFTRIRSIPTSGVPWSLQVSDLGGLPGPDVAVGFRDSDERFGGRVEIYYCDAGTLPPRGSDPSAGSLAGWVPALGSGRFRSASPRHPNASPRDLVAGVRTGPRQGAVEVFVR